MAKPKQPQAPRVLGTYKKTDGRFEVRYVDATGKQRSKYRNNKRAADALARQLATTITNDLAAQQTDDIDWYELLKKIALAATDAGDYAAAVSAAKASVTFMPPPPPKDVTADLTKADKRELFDNFIAALEAEGYTVTKKGK